MKKDISRYFRQGVLWSRRLKNLDYEKDARYIIHHVLMYGDLEDIRALMKIYSSSRVRNIFLKKPLPIYTKPALNFLAKFILGVKIKKIDRSKYVKTLS